MKKYISAIFLTTLLVPSITFASWWNPLSWKVFNSNKILKVETPQIQNKPATQATTTIKNIATTTTKIKEKNDKKSQKQTVNLIPKSEVKNSVINLPSGAIVEMDTQGNIVRYIKQPVKEKETQDVSIPKNDTPNVLVPLVAPPSPTIQPLLTPTLSCTKDVWSCSGWSVCSNSGSQTRSCNITTECSTANTPSPNTTQSCTPPVQPVSISVEDVSSVERIISITNLSSEQLAIEKLRLRMSSLVGKDGVSISPSDTGYVSLSVNFPKSYDKNFYYGFADNLTIKENGIFDFVWRQQVGKNCYGYVDSTAIPKECLRTNTNRPHELLGQTLLSNELRPNETINIRIALDPRVLAGYSTIETTCPKSYQFYLDYVTGSIIKKSTGENVPFPSLSIKEAKLNDVCQVSQ